MSSSSDEEDEAPPPLEDVSQELSKLGVKDASYEAKSSEKKGKAKSDTGAAQKNGLRRGFFDAPRKRTKPKGNASQKSGREGLVEIKAKKSGPGGSGPESKVPDWMKIDPNSDQAKLMQMKDKVVDAMKPTPDMMQNVMQNADLMKGFDNPEVMQAVNDIAKNPENVKKYKNNPQVMAFYQSMAKTMASRFEQLAAEEEDAKGKGTSKEKSHHGGGGGGQRGDTREPSFKDKLVVTDVGDGSSRGAERAPPAKEFTPLIEELN